MADERDDYEMATANEETVARRELLAEMTRDAVESGTYDEPSLGEVPAADLEALGPPDTFIDLCLRTDVHGPHMWKFTRAAFGWRCPGIVAATPPGRSADGYRLVLTFTAADDRQAARLGMAWADTASAEYGTRGATVKRADGTVLAGEGISAVGDRLGDHVARPAPLLTAEQHGRLFGRPPGEVRAAIVEAIGGCLSPAVAPNMVGVAADRVMTIVGPPLADRDDLADRLEAANRGWDSADRRADRFKVKLANERIRVSELVKERDEQRQRAERLEAELGEEGLARRVLETTIQRVWDAIRETGNLQLIQHIGELIKGRTEAEQGETADRIEYWRNLAQAAEHDLAQRDATIAELRDQLGRPDERHAHIVSENADLREAVARVRERIDHWSVRLDGTLLADVVEEFRAALDGTDSKRECRCETAADLGVPPEIAGVEIAHVHPECPIHGDGTDGGDRG